MLLGRKKKTEKSTFFSNYYFTVWTKKNGGFIMTWISPNENVGPLILFIFTHNQFKMHKWSLSTPTNSRVNEFSWKKKRKLIWKRREERERKKRVKMIMIRNFGKSHQWHACKWCYASKYSPKKMHSLIEFWARYGFHSLNILMLKVLSEYYKIEFKLTLVFSSMFVCWNPKEIYW